MNILETHIRHDGMQLAQFAWKAEPSHFAYAMLTGDYGIKSVTLNCESGNYIIFTLKETDL